MTEILSASFRKIQEKLIRCNELANGAHPSDVRSTTFGIMLAQVRVYVLLSSPEILNRNDISDLDRDNAERRVRYDFFITLFSTFESAIKIIIRTLPKNEQNSKIHKYLEKCVTPESNKGFLLAKELRNCIHNNGFYFPNVSKEDSVFYFNGNTYNLLYGKAVDFLTWELSINLIIHLIEVLEQVFAQLSTKIVEDPIANNS
ncbi:hypothetical protein PCIT_a3065 [Pseudoalteromonas citrea]|uniref:Uncharacterized protein n=2 Tax=Pseudoalteromonas citrea TaxID=43655 RepID=A0AAD4AI71_9GAMM|nr:hypothetical protein [Pseudoalteromonas citrea]KAF7770106.1 hypothetical protein PCIT_a3065 [Pseudoalteromonas citrea]